MVFKDVTVRFVLVYAMPAQAHADAAAFITTALARGALKHQIHRVFTLDEIVAAHEATESMANVGKVLVRVE
jgi:NADPH2:quinone reductase